MISHDLGDWISATYRDADARHLAHYGRTSLGNSAAALCQREAECETPDDVPRRGRRKLRFDAADRRHQVVMDAVRRHPGASTQELHRLLGLGYAAVYGRLRSLAERGMVAQSVAPIGGGKPGAVSRWTVAEARP